MTSGKRTTQEVIGRRILRQGMQGEDVKSLQARLNHLGYEAGPEDGIFGYLTRDAVKQFQAAHGLQQDGIAGSQVFAALLGRFPLSQITHIVGAKEPLTAIAERYQVPVNLLVNANRLTPGTRPYRLQRLVIPIRSVIGFCVRSPLPGEWSPLSIERSLKHLTFLSPTWATIGVDGRVSGLSQGKGAALAALHGVGILPSVKFSESGIPDADATRGALVSRGVRDAAIKGVMELVSRLDASGIILWLSEVVYEDWYRALSFVTMMARRLHSLNKCLVVALPVGSEEEVPEGTSPGMSSHVTSFPSAYYEGLGRAADQVIILTFDEHTREGKPGPVSSLDWVKKAVRQVLRGVPCWKVLITIPVYGYDWPEPRREAPSADLTATVLSYGEISALMEIFKPEISLNDEAFSPGFRYRSCRVTHHVFFENEVSVRAKLDFVLRYHLGGVAIYYLGPEDPLIWSAIREKFMVRAEQGGELVEGAHNRDHWIRRKSPG